MAGYFTLTLLSEKRPPKPACQSVDVQRGTIKSSVYGMGTVKPKQLFHIKARRSGKITAILVKKDADVTERQRLIRMVPESGFAVELDNLRYNLYTARVQRETLEDHLNKQRKLFERGLVAQAVIAELERNLTKSVKAERLALERLKVMAQETGQPLISSAETGAPSAPPDIFILSPAAGTILEINKQVGDVITADKANLYARNETDVVVLADLSTLYTECKVNEIDIKSVQVGQAAIVRLEAQPDKVYSGVIEKISTIAAPRMPSANLMDGGLNFFTTVVKILDPDKMVRSGMTCNVQIVVREKKAVLMLPVETVAHWMNQEIVFHESGDTFESLIVTTGISDEHRVEITSGLTENMSVCDRPLVFIEWQEQIRRFDQRNFIEKLLQ